MPHPFRPIYTLELKALTYQRSLGAPPEGHGSRLRQGLRSDPELRVVVLPEELRLEVAHHYTSGHMWVIDDERDRLEDPPEDVLPAAVLASIDALRADPSCWSPDAVLGLFRPMQGDGPEEIAPSEAAWLEWGASVTGDGKLPYLTLRLGREGCEIVQDHSFHFSESVRRLEPVARPATLDDVRAHFGEDMARAVAAFGQERSRWLP